MTRIQRLATIQNSAIQNSTLTKTQMPNSPTIHILKFPMIQIPTGQVLCLPRPSSFRLPNPIPGFLRQAALRLPSSAQSEDRR